MSAAVCAGCTFLVLVPLFLSHTLSSPGFVTSMGIGDAQLRLDLASAQTAGFVTERLEKDEQVKKWSLLTTYGQTVRLTDGTTLSLPVETGDLEAFPVTCDKGRLPEKENELALSVLAARELNLEPGDTLQLEDQPELFSSAVCTRISPTAEKQPRLCTWKQSRILYGLWDTLA